MWIQLFTLLKKSTVILSKLRWISGGAEGNRTPVRKQLGKNFSGRSLLFAFPFPGGNKHPTGIGSFMMRGMGKAYHTHVLRLNHTRARVSGTPGADGRLIRQPGQQYCCQLNLKSYPFYRGQVPRPAIPASLPPSKPVRPRMEERCWGFRRGIIPGGKC